MRGGLGHGEKVGRAENMENVQKKMGFDPNAIFNFRAFNNFRN